MNNPFFETIEPRTFLSGTRLTSTQKADLTQLSNDLMAIHAKSGVTKTEVKAVGTDFENILAVATKPSSSSVSKLENDAKAAWSDHVVTSKEKALLASDIQAVLVSAGVPSSLAQQTATDIKAVLVSSNITTADVQTIGADLEALASTFTKKA